MVTIKEIQEHYIPIIRESIIKTSSFKNKEGVYQNPTVEVSFALSYALSRSLTRLERIVKSTEPILKDILDYRDSKLIKDENGNLIYKEDGSLDISEELMAEINKRWKDALSLEVDPNLYTVPISKIGEVNDSVLISTLTEINLIIDDSN